MTVEGWISLWSFMLWASMSALSLLAVYVVVGYVRSLRKRK